MPLDLGSVGRALDVVTRDWSDRDALLYALSIGAGPQDLPFVTENSRGQTSEVYPTFGVVLCDITRAVPHIGRVPVSRLLHGAHSLSVFAPLPQSGALKVTAEVSGIYDAGVGGHAIIDIVSRGREPESGSVIVESTGRLVLRGGGGFRGNPVPPSPGTQALKREPDHVAEQQTRPDQALLYRLTGDRNPLHSDPWFARERAGFEGPILHGLCTFGFAGRALLAALGGDDPASFISMECRFSAPVYPGETLRTSIWLEGPQAAFQTEAFSSAGDRRVVLSHGLYRLPLAG